MSKSKRSSGITIEELLAQVTTKYEHDDQRSKKTLANHIRHLLSFPAFKNGTAKTMTRDDCEKYVDYRKREGAINATINRERAAFVYGYNLADLRPPKWPRLAENNVREGFVTVGEFQAVKKVLSGVHLWIYIFGFYNGWRISEILSLKRTAFDPLTRTVRIERRYTKNKRARTVGVSGECLQAVLAAYEQNNEYLFAHKAHGKISQATFYMHIKVAFATAGYPKRIFHDLRRSASRNLILAGADEKRSMAVTGHATRQHFDRYNIVDEQDLVTTAQKYQDHINALKAATDDQGAILEKLAHQQPSAAAAEQPVAYEQQLMHATVESSDMAVAPVDDGQLLGPAVRTGNYGRFHAPQLPADSSGGLPKLLTLREVAAALRVAPRTVSRLQLPVVRIGGTLRFREDDVGRYILAQLSLRKKEASR